MNSRKVKPIAAAIGTAFAMSLTTGAVTNEVDVFEAELIEDGALLATGHKEGFCGEDDARCGEGRCGEGSCGEAEASCGEGSCGASEEGSCGASESDDDRSR